MTLAQTDTSLIPPAAASEKASAPPAVPKPEAIEAQARGAAERLDKDTNPRSATAFLILRALVEAGEPLDLEAVSWSTGIDGHELSWRLGRMAQQSLVSRVKRRNKITGERFFYYLDEAQTEHAKALPEERNSGETNAYAGPNIEILKLLVEYGKSLEPNDIATRLNLTKADVAWRLIVLCRQDLVARTRKNVTVPYRYFLRRDQRTSILDRLDGKRALQEREVRIADLTRQLGESQIRAVELDKEVRMLESQLTAKLEEIDARTLSRTELTQLNAKAIARAQSDPVALSKRLGFIKKLRERPALEPEAMLKDIEMDYTHALLIARKD